jgi:PEP-CTERM motif.
MVGGVLRTVKNRGAPQHPQAMKTSTFPIQPSDKPFRRDGAPRPRSTLIRVLPVLALTCASFVQAAPITMVQSNETSGSSWLNPASWSNNQAPSAGNDYFVTNFFTVRAPQPAAASYTFAGDSLTITNARFLFATLQASTIIVNNLTLANGMFSNGTNFLQTLQGTLTVDGAAYVRLHTIAADNGRNITINSQISGSGNFGLIQKGTLTLTGVGNTFSGTWTVGGTMTVPDGTYSNSSNLISTLVADSEGSLGVNSSVTLDIWSRFDVNYDWTTSGALTLAGNGGTANAIIMTLDQNITVGALSIAGFAFDPGTYGYDELSSLGYADYFTNGGGTITVVPEPHSLALIALGSMAVAFCGRRLRNGRP